MPVKRMLEKHGYSIAFAALTVVILVLMWLAPRLIGG